MSATVAAALKKIAIYILGDEKKRGKLFVLIGSIAAGFLGLMCLPVAVLSSMGSLEIETLHLRQTNKNHRKYGGFLLYTRFLHDCVQYLHRTFFLSWVEVRVGVPCH